MIGVMGSAVFPGRIGEPTRVLVLSRRLEGSARRLLPVLAGTVFSQTLINLLALAILAAVTFTSVPLLQPRGARALGGAVVPLLICLLVVAGPRLLRLAQRSRSLRVALAAAALARMLRPRAPGAGRVRAPAPRRPRGARAAARLDAAVARLLRGPARARAAVDGGLAAAAAILLAVNVSAILPATPSNVGVFQAACLVVLAAYGVGAGPGARLRDHPAGRRGPDGARAGRPRAARRGHDLAGHPAPDERRASRVERLREPQPTSARSDWRSECVVCSTAVGS